MQGKQVIQTLCPTEYNIKEQSNVYVAKKVSLPQEFTRSHNPEEPKSPQMEDMSNSIVSYKFCYTAKLLQALRAEIKVSVVIKFNRLSKWNYKEK